MGKKPVIVEPGRHLGGMTSGGLGATDIGNKAAIGGIAREFYQAVARHYARDDAWPLERPQDYFRQRAGAAIPDLNSPGATLWTFEPHVAEDIFFQMLNEARVPVYFVQRLAAVTKTGPRLTAILMENGKVYRAKMFIECHIRRRSYGQGRGKLHRRTRGQCPIPGDVERRPGGNPKAPVPAGCRSVCQARPAL